MSAPAAGALAQRLAVALRDHADAVRVLPDVAAMRARLEAPVADEPARTPVTTPVARLQPANRTRRRAGTVAACAALVLGGTGVAMASGAGRPRVPESAPADPLAAARLATSDGADAPVETAQVDGATARAATAPRPTPAPDEPPTDEPAPDEATTSSPEARAGAAPSTTGRATSPGAPGTTVAPGTTATPSATPTTTVAGTASTTIPPVTTTAPPATSTTTSTSTTTTTTTSTSTTTTTVTVAFTAVRVNSTSNASPPYADYSGTANPGATISVTSAYGSADATANAQGNWSVRVTFPTAPVGLAFRVRATTAQGIRSFTFTRVA